ncbi:MAG: DNA repair protein RecO [Geminicoccales bacterium]
MFWQDEGVLLSARRHGETSAVISVFTLAHGRHAGLVRGGAGRRARPLYQPGNRLHVTWRARLTEQLGSFTAELLAPTAAHVLDRPDRLLGLGAACVLLDSTLPERDPHPNLYNILIAFLDRVSEEGAWLEDYVRFELALLAELGFGLDLSACAVTGTQDDLAYVSPRSGRAVSRGAARPYVDRLLPLPGFLLGAEPADRAQILAGLRLTGAFLQRHIFDAAERPMPAARERLLGLLARDPKR